MYGDDAHIMRRRLRQHGFVTCSSTSIASSDMILTLYATPSMPSNESIPMPTILHALCHWSFLLTCTEDVVTHKQRHAAHHSHTMTASPFPTTNGPNPYTPILHMHPTPTTLTTAYQTHRLTRLTQQRAALTSPTFPGLNTDPILSRLLHEESLPPAKRTGYKDERHNIVLWARPPSRVIHLIARVQDRLRETQLGRGRTVHSQPLEKLHLTVFEVAHSLSLKGQEERLGCISEGLVQESTAFCAVQAEKGRKARVGRPMVVYDGRAVAVSWIPVVSSTARGRVGRAREDGEVADEAAAEDKDGVGGHDRVGDRDGELENDGEGGDAGDEGYTYHHLRRDLWALFNEHDVPVASRYVLPSCHMTIARFVSLSDASPKGSSSAPEADILEAPEEMRAFVEKIDEINAWLEGEYAGEEGEWVVGEEKGLDFRIGTCWYGGGETVRLGRALDVESGGF